ncbi:bifunctional phosphopantothenoylcysteine decarboxylase/phosphopantothenate--cysteine ligase CoaBC [Gluconobacter cerinus]|uniref:bifunctional phosphopantothenoylcysteine decarboxylase/phosphopantothenate--cysteine ligase CoaBC n=1 Tax=Gluconobacter TaxID=441 RepID=UPI001B8C3344|nr:MULTISPECIES: bifunctional phosphopantothenoylcysteine decarboxylase/phosphopantothenate--cysteine ligase CoaBC [Gluconobacter]MBS0994547.1 bifunctional phosphopantothenoylcysteine decarboxylase/phosphopantothenate--cysteine ligase CoaBC [Gluconobacter cerinus]MBS1021967.1 bifunctional phosphopantothenoylcysteine decarboxylase/phosphopantothenate--cysteine ligase CoaBC [Gluconobacter cerinus]MBS1041169.1 bifunctional phosphopantothenoylcysteine decarboxylase/phosphopantothenate--cysteine liga
MRRVLLIVGGGIAAYRALELVRLLKADNVSVTPVMTDAAKAFITPLSLEALSGERVHDALFAPTQESEIGHIALARSADLVVVCPATANLMARMAHGMADDLATTLLLATTTPILLAPAMNVRMWEHPATQANLALLKERGVRVVGPDEGSMACGEFGPGRLSQPDVIRDAILEALASDHSLAGRHALVTAGPTVEPLDPVRFLSNHSSGKQGYAIAAALAARGAKVTLVSGPVTLPVPAGVVCVKVQTAREMLGACEAALPAEIAVCTAAVSDWRAKAAAQGKIKKTSEGPPVLELVENPDILATLCRLANRPKLIVGFAAETDDVLDNAVAKRQRKGCDWLVANDVRRGVFGADRNLVSLITETGIETWPEMDKSQVAGKLVQRISDVFVSSIP